MKNKSIENSGTSRPHRLGAAALFLSVALPFMGAAGSALAADADTVTLAARSVCHATLGLNPGNSDFRACVDSLSQSRRQELADAAQSKAIQAASTACEHAGSPTSPAYATCVLDHSDSHHQVAQVSIEQGE